MHGKVGKETCRGLRSQYFDEVQNIAIAFPCLYTAFFLKVMEDTIKMLLLLYIEYIYIYLLSTKSKMGDPMNFKTTKY